MIADGAQHLILGVFADLRAEFVVNPLALGFADLLIEDLLGVLGGDAAEAFGRAIDAKLVANLRLFDLVGLGTRGTGAEHADRAAGARFANYRPSVSKCKLPN